MDSGFYSAKIKLLAKNDPKPVPATINPETLPLYYGKY